MPAPSEIRLAAVRRPRAAACQVSRNSGQPRISSTGVARAQSTRCTTGRTSASACSSVPEYSSRLKSMMFIARKAPTPSRISSQAASNSSPSPRVTWKARQQP